MNSVQSGKVTLDDIAEKELPEELQKMTPEQHKAHVEKLAKDREKIQAEIRDLNEKRNAYIAEERKKLAEKNKTETLDQAVIKSLRTQAAKKNYKFGN